MHSPPAPSEDSIPPPPEIPAISFRPSLQLIRQRTVQNVLEAISATPRFEGKLTRLLDVGCGDASFLRRLTPCVDELPLGSMTGIDVDEAQANSVSWETLRPGPNEKNDRWRPFQIKLWHGSFEGLDFADVGYHDVIVSFEVIEHLDPHPLSQFAPILLGRMKPKVLVVTTPNRDFNSLFDYLENLNPDGVKKETFRRDGIPYRMRHHDHRFEWTRQEFRCWALAAAETYGYDVGFSGMGGFGNCGIVIDGGENAYEILGEAARTCETADSLPSGNSTWEELKEIVRPPYADDSEGANALRKAFGDCSQFAVFVIKPEMEQTQKPFASEERVQGHTLRLVHQHYYPYDESEVFPPSLEMVMSMLMEHGRLMHLLPDLIRDEWAKDDKQVLREYLYWLEHGYPRDDFSSFDRWSRDNEISQQERQNLFAKMGGRLWEVKCVELVLDAEWLWGESYKLRRACHFKYDLFLDIISQVKAAGETPQIIVDTTIDDDGHKLKIDVRKAENCSIVTASFPASKPLVANPWAKPGRFETELGDSDHEYDEFEEYDDFEPYFERYNDSDNEEPDFGRALDGSSSPIYDAELASEQGDSGGDVDTVIEWVAYTDGNRAKNCLPDTPATEGTFDLNEQKPEGDYFFRIRFFAPKRDLDFESPAVKEAAAKIQRCEEDIEPEVQNWMQEEDEEPEELEQLGEGYYEA
ncbi:hypothetical protein FN846DRAFT_994504 [Sphaerosporella brunnea]|uniref:Small RNA 2'-O-methyltransferase n=1 Tax=Sphaerosporella brunnea TaxID=1250544 RepID=A0A5J5EKC2_9PEZI|nr:hypothetical protein FN846DRAFT_994504 [Sphaerosporella brunnea]